MNHGRGLSPSRSWWSISTAWTFLSFAAPASASDSALPPRWSVEAGWWQNHAGSDLERHWSSGPTGGVSMEFLRHPGKSGFVRFEYASIAPDLAAVEDYYLGAVAESDGRASVTLLTVGLRTRPGGYGNGGLGQGGLAKLSSTLEFGAGLGVVNESAFHYTYTSAVPPATYTIPEESNVASCSRSGLASNGARPREFPSISMGGPA